MLSLLAMDVEKSTSEHSRPMKFGFGERSKWLPIGWTGRTKAQFDSTRLESTIVDFITRKGDSKTDLLNDGSL